MNTFQHAQKITFLFSLNSAASLGWLKRKTFVVPKRITSPAMNYKNIGSNCSNLKYTVPLKGKLPPLVLFHETRILFVLEKSRL